MRQPDQYYNTKLAGHALNRKLIAKNKHLRQCVAINVFYGCCLQVSFSNKIKRLQKKSLQMIVFCMTGNCQMFAPLILDQ